METTVKADLGKRFLAYFIDSLLAGIAGAVVGILLPALGAVISAGYMLVRDGLDLEFMDRRSIGKRLMKLRPVRLDGQAMDVETSMRRNWMFALGGLGYGVFGFGLGKLVAVAGAVLFFYEVYKVITASDGRRWGDELAGTQVVVEEIV